MTRARTGTHRRSRQMSGLLATGLVVAATFALTGCPKKGAAQRAGEKLDRAKDTVSDTLDPKGPAEKAGRKIDRATD